jgi:CBS domain containing-hemolysin-like protein|tara:strand:- start:16380 stop:17651 length:1272 start_codon:yes stop_codon:yes gene_type:complete
MELQLIVIVISILLSAFFSGMEIAFVSANKMHIELEKKREGFIAKILTRLTQKSSKFITTMLVGNNIALVVYSFFMGEFLVELFPIDFFNEFTLLLIQTFISTILILVTAEFIPKAIFRIYADDFLKIFAVPAYFFFLLFHFISEFMTAISDFCLWVLFNTSDDVEQTEFSKAELEMYITEQIKKTNGNEELDSEIQIFQNALVFNDVKAREVMIPRIEILALDIGETLSAAKNLFIETGYTKIIVYKNSLDEILGYVHAFDMFKKPKSLRSIILPVEFIPESMMINDILNVLTKKKKSLAVVLDEYGGTSGLLTVEDIVEELFGEIEDEHDTLELKEVMINENEYKFSARLEVDYLNETYSLKLPEDEAYETLGGLVVYHSENIPTEKEVILIGNYEFIILTASSTKIDEIYLKISENKESS